MGEKCARVNGAVRAADACVRDGVGERGARGNFFAAGHRFVARAGALILAAAGMITGGCGIDFEYLIPAAAGQVRLLARTTPIEVAIERGELSEEQIAKLELIQDARLYAQDVMKLSVGRSYTSFYNSGSEPVAYNVSASRKDAFVPRLWSFPVVGTVPYLGYFDRAAADAKFQELVDQGYDVLMYEIDAYSGIGVIPNIVLSPMLERSDVSLIDTVFHELLHATVWRPNDTSFNESLATFFGRTGTIHYLSDRYPDRPELVEEAAAGFEDSDRYTAFMLTLYGELEAFYASDLSSEAKIAGREAIYQAGRERFAAEVQPLMNRPEQYDWVVLFPANNAWMLSVRRYNLDLEVFAEVFAAAGEDWSAAVEVFGAAADRDDPYAYLRIWLESP